jgi:hypothetical protein
MMFGVGGYARGLDPFSVYGSAGTFNVLDDWLRAVIKREDGPGLLEAFFSADGRGAIPGYMVAQQQAYTNKASFCSIINGWRFIGYNDNGDQAASCAACTDIGIPLDRTNPADSQLVNRYVSGRPGAGPLRDLLGYIPGN